MNDGRILRAWGWALLWSMCVAALPATAAPRFRLTDTATMVPGQTFQAAALNDRGQLAGSGSDGRALIVTPGQAQPVDIGTLPSRYPGFSTIARPAAINNHGQVAGSVHYNATDTDPPMSGRGFLYTPGTGMVDIGSLPTHLMPWASAVDLNDRGVLLGMSVGGDRWETVTYSLGRGLEVIPTPLDTFVSRINDKGQIMGFHVTNTYDASFIFHRGAVTNLGNLGFPYACAHDINDRGSVTGGSSNDGTSQQAFLYTQATGMRDLMAGASNDGFINTEGKALNNRGQVVGEGWDGADLAAFYFDEQTGIVHLSKLVEPTDLVGWHLGDAFAINAHGQILAYGLYSNTNQYTVVLLTPVQGSNLDHGHHGHGHPHQGR